MAQQTQARNPFMLMINPEVVFAAIENSERLSGLNRHLCRPLDRQSIAVSAGPTDLSDQIDDEPVDSCDD